MQKGTVSAALGHAKAAPTFLAGNQSSENQERLSAAGVPPKFVGSARFQDVIAFREQLEIYRYWESLRHGNTFPVRQDFDPTEVHSTLPNLGLIDVSYSGDGTIAPEFTYRLVGSEIQSFFPESLKGKTLHQAKNPAYADYLFGIYSAATRHGAPIYVQENNKLPSGYYIFRGRIYLPAEPDKSGRPTILIYSTLDPERADLKIGNADVEAFPRDHAKVWILSE